MSNKLTINLQIFAEGISCNYSFRTNGSTVHMGCTEYNVDMDAVKAMIAKNQIHFSPAGVAFVTDDVVRGLIPELLQDILNVRIMVKNSMKLYPQNTVFISTGFFCIHRPMPFEC